MLEKLTVKNFQSHKDSELNFSEGVNTIIGTTDHGKSSIFRSLCLVCNNKPDGTHFVSHWLKNEKGKLKGSTECSLNIDDNIISRRKGILNEYEVNGKIYKAFNRDVPTQVSEILNLGDYSIQPQNESFFLLNLPKTKVAEEFNKIVNLEIIDYSVNNVNSLLREKKTDYKVNNELSIDYSKQIEQFTDLPQREKDVEKLIQLENSISKDYDKVSTLTKCIYGLKSILNEIENYNKMLNLKPKIEKLITKFLDLDKCSLKISEMKKTIEKLRLTFRHLAKCREVVSAEKKLLDLSKLMSQYNEYDFINTLSSNVLQIKHVTSEIKSLNSKISQYEKEYHNIMPETCPVCNRPLNHEIHLNSR